MGSNWNYEGDLELVKQKLSTCSPSEKHKIQRLITEILQAPLADGLEPRNLISKPEGFSKDTQNPLQSIPLTPECLDLDPSLILNVIRLMHQFKKDFQGTRKLLEDKEIENTVTWNIFQVTNRTQLNNLWNVFSVYVQKAVRSYETTGSQPKCPLKVDVVLAQIFGYLPTKDLLNSRLVSQAWNNKITQWEFPKRRECATTLSFDRLVPIIQATISSPFIFSKLNIRLEGIRMSECNSFFTNYGPYIKTLELYAEPLKTLTQHDITRSSSLFELIFNLRTIFQNLSQVQDLSIISLPEPVLQQPFVFTPEEAFTLPTVRSLELYLSCDFSTDFSEGFFSMLFNVKSLHLTFMKPTNEFPQVLDGIQKLKLRSLNIFCGTDSRANIWTSLESQHLKILTANTYLNSDEDVASFQKFVQSQSQTLEAFTCNNFRKNRTIHTAQISAMQNLETLAFELFGLYPFDPMTPQQLPKLRSTTFKFSEVSKYFSDDNFDTVQELSSSQNQLGLLATDWNWKFLGSRFPNVTRLSVNSSYGLSGSSASGVFRCFPNLEYLGICVFLKESAEINYLLSGFTPERVAIMSQLLATLKSPEELLQVEPEHASLRDMKKLKELQMEVIAEWGEDEIYSVIKDVRIRLGLMSIQPLDEIYSVINDVGIRLGLMSIQPLDKLSIAGFFTISEDGAELLKNYHRNVHIYPATS